MAEVAELADACDPVVLDLVAAVVAAADAHGAWVGLCGEAASDPAVAGALVRFGVRELSMVSAALAEVKDLLARHDLATLAEAAAGRSLGRLGPLHAGRGTRLTLRR